MNYKKQLVKVLPSSYVLKRRYFQRLGKKLNLKHPKTFNEKIQWLKLHDRKKEYPLYVDKYEVKKLISKWFGNKYIIPTIGVWNNYNQIDFDLLPEKFVLKCTHDSGSVKICKNKDLIDHQEWKKWFEEHLAVNWYDYCREWVYKTVKPRIIAEQYMDSLGDNGIIDYKFFCFNGNPELLYISIGLEDHSTAKISFYDMNGNEMPFYRSDYNQFHNAVFPENFSEMKSIAEIIAKNVNSPFVRVDLYSVENKVYFSEITFYPNAGYIPFTPPEYDLILGEKIILPYEE